MTTKQIFDNFNYYNELPIQDKKTIAKCNYYLLLLFYVLHLTQPEQEHLLLLLNTSQLDQFKSEIKSLF